ncbi:hypothetical protein OPV22_010660 [Ensete ventricosum]|uniref:RING-type domain-containing protein n=1 Tax=Ensete ventricosum TaxID=4639 RepID=A0AAV8R7X5_ENSVE|nr:hypothetical protein OPV22_010660 [Ensete ventricosum]RWW81790.1 hypothetical protein BHE74_00009778 [Ensete ventricosum]
MEAERIGRRKWMSLKQRLALMGCCASSWGFRASNPTLITDEIYPEEQAEEVVVGMGGATSAEEMNLAEALAAERNYRAASAAEVGRVEGKRMEAPMPVSLMRLLEEGEENGGGGEGWCCCCVCMGGRKGAAFIPCGHTFCRLCARQLLADRGTCPLCNRPILDILDIF